MRFFLCYLLWRHLLPVTEKKVSLLDFFFSRTNEVKTCGIVQQMMLGMLRYLILQSRDIQSLNGDPPLDLLKESFEWNVKEGPNVFFSRYKGMIFHS